PTAPPRSLRNVFEYGDGTPRVAAAAPAAAPPSLLMAPAAPPPSAPPAVRLIGLVRRGGQLKAALAVVGKTVVLAPGESASGYTVVSIDEEEGVQLKAPDGSPLRLLLPASE